MDKSTNDIGFVQNGGKSDSRVTHRMHLALSDKTMDAINVLSERLEASTTSETIRRSLMLVYSITSAISNGGKVVIENADGSKKELIIA